MSLNEALPRRAFSLRYFATQEFEVSLKSATAVATFGSFLSKVIVVLTLLITSSVSFTYSSSDAASAGASGTTEETREAVRDKNSRRRGWVAVAVVGVRVAETTVVGLGLIVVSDLGVEVGVISVGEAMVLEKER